MRTNLISAILLTLATIGLTAAPAAAQITSVDPNTVIDGDLDGNSAPPPIYTAPSPPNDYAVPYDTPPPPQDAQPGVTYDSSSDAYPAGEPEVSDAQGSDIASATPPANVPTPGDDQTYQEDDLIGAAEGVFGKGAEGLATLIEDLLAKQGRPNAYITGREASGAFVVGLRYGSGTLFHKVEGDRKVYWTGPSIGFDAGGNAAQTFVLVYNLYDSQDLYRRFPAGEGAAYLVGGFTASYLRRGDIVLIPIRLGVGARLGINVGYMRFSDKQKWLPF